MPGLTATLIVQALPLLSEADRARVMAALMVTGTKRSAEAPVDQSDAEFVLGCVINAIEHVGLEYPGKEHLKKSAAYKIFVDKVPATMKYLRLHFKTKVERQRALSLGVVLLHQELSSMGGSVQARRILAHIHRVPAVFNKAFPGYAESKLLHLTVRRRGHA